ncbi:MAG: hypothetical protein FJZ87_00670 [Chloroflexi bacterium]|nr:hypothetical protein [Chloroflexota bacterium]
MDTSPEIRLARAAYGWLRISPLLTGFTFFLIWGMDPGGFVCGEIDCAYGDSLYFSLLAAVLGSALWHLILLQYLNHKTSQFVRKHGRSALLLAGFRTSVPLGLLILDFLADANGLLLGCTAIPILILLWAVNTTSGYKDINRELGLPPSAGKETGSKESPELLPQTAISHPSSNSNAIDRSASKQAPEETLTRILNDLDHESNTVRRQALEELESLTFGSEALRRKVEALALHEEDETLRRAALDALGNSMMRHVQSRLNKVSRGDRYVLLREIDVWEKLDYVTRSVAEVLRRRYDFDFARTEPSVKLVQVQPPTPVDRPVSPARPSPAPAAPLPAASISTPSIKKPEPAAPRPTLLQALLSETSIKIYLYLGAFFVIASAVILGTLFEAARLPILIAGTLLFGGTAVSIRSRLPQPSFALFIVFSFLLPITANVAGESLNLTAQGRTAYWMTIYLVMTLLWSGSTWIYESRLFSLSAFLSLLLALYRAADLVQGRAELHTSLIGMAALIGLFGVRRLIKWKNFKFSLPLFITAQITQLSAVIAALSLFLLRLAEVDDQPLWHAVSVLTILAACQFFILSHSTVPFFAFPWLAAGVLIPLPWFVIATNGENPFPGSWLATLTYTIWALILSGASEPLYSKNRYRSYSLPSLLASIPIFSFAILNSLLHTDAQISNLLVFAVSLITAGVFGGIHAIRRRGWLWAISLAFFALAYFFLLNIQPIKVWSIYHGFEVLGLILLFMLPDLLLKKDFTSDPPWRVPPRIFGAILSLWVFLRYSMVLTDQSLNSGILFGILAVVFALYSTSYRKPGIGYVITVSLAISAIHILHYMDLDLWSETLSILAVLYYLIGFAIRRYTAHSDWGSMFAISGLALGSLTSIVALFTLRQGGGWLIALTGTFYLFEMHARRSEYLEIGTHVQVPAGIFLLLNEILPDEIAYILLGWSICWLGIDAVLSKTFKSARLLAPPVRIVGSLATLLATMVLLAEGDSRVSAICFGIYTVFFVLYTGLKRRSIFGYLPASFLALTLFFTLDHSSMDIWLPALSGLAAVYFLTGFGLSRKADWSYMLRNSSLGLGGVLSLGALISPGIHNGWYVAFIGILFIVEMHIRKQALFEIGPQLLIPAAVCLILADFKVSDEALILLGLSLTWLSLDLVFARTFAGQRKRSLEQLTQIAGAGTALFSTVLLIVENDLARASICFAIFTAFFALHTFIRRKPVFAYLPLAYLPMTIYYTLGFFEVDAWLPSLTILAIIYFVVGLGIRHNQDWSLTIRNGALVLGSILSIGALLTFKPGGGWYALLIGLIFAVEMHLRRNGWLEVGVPAMFNIGAFLILTDFKIKEPTYHLLAYSLVWILSDLLAHLTYAQPRRLKWTVRGIAAVIAAVNYALLIINGIRGEPAPAALCFGVYSLASLLTSLGYREPKLMYTFTSSTSLFGAFLFQVYEMSKWIHPVVTLAVIFYAVGYLLRRARQTGGWDIPLRYSGLGLGLIVSAAAPVLGGLDAAIPVALAATLWAVEAFHHKNAWLGFPANALYLLAYFIVLFELQVDEVQFFSMGAALLGLIQHYLLNRSGAKTGAFITGMVSQLILLGTTYIQMLNTEELIYFVVLFLQSIAVMIYGIVIRSRSLTFAPIALVILGVVTVIYSALRDISTVVLIGCTGIILLGLGILAVILRERITRLGERLSSWEA